MARLVLRWMVISNSDIIEALVDITKNFTFRQTLTFWWNSVWHLDIRLVAIHPIILKMAWKFVYILAIETLNVCQSSRQIRNTAFLQESVKHNRDSYCGTEEVPPECFMGFFVIVNFICLQETSVIGYKCWRNGWERCISPLLGDAEKPLTSCRGIDKCW